MGFLVGVAREQKTLASVTFRDQMMHPISSSHMNDRYNNSIERPPKAISRQANLNLRYVDPVRYAENFPNNLKRQDGNESPSPIQSDHSSPLSESSTHTLLATSTTEAPITHQDIMGEINDEIQRGLVTHNPHLHGGHLSPRRLSRHAGKLVYVSLGLNVVTCLFTCWLLPVIHIYEKRASSQPFRSKT